MHYCSKTSFASSSRERPCPAETAIAPSTTAPILIITSIGAEFQRSFATLGIDIAEDSGIRDGTWLKLNS